MGSRFTWLIVGFLALPASAEVTVTPVMIRETRTRELVKPDPAASRFFSSELEITLKLSGKELDGATEYQLPTVSEAIDDTSASLVDKENPFSGFQQIQRHSFGPQAQKTPPTSDFEVKVSLKVPARNAKALKSVKGAVKVRAGGEKKEVLVKSPGAMAGKAIEDPALTAAKVGIKFADAKAGKPANPRELMLDITGDRTPIKSMEVIGADGNAVSNGFSSFTFNGNTQYSVSLNKPLDETMSLRVSLIIGQQVLDVPFELKDLPLP